MCVDRSKQSPIRKISTFKVEIRVRFEEVTRKITTVNKQGKEIE